VPGSDEGDNPGDDDGDDDKGGAGSTLILVPQTSPHALPPGVQEV
jgi:hypothetical protein